MSVIIYQCKHNLKFYLHAVVVRERSGFYRGPSIAWKTRNRDDEFISCIASQSMYRLIIAPKRNIYVYLYTLTKRIVTLMEMDVAHQFC